MIRFVTLCLICAVAFACSWDYLIWIPRNESADSLYRFMKNGKAGYIDREGKIVIKPTLEAFGNYGGAFQDGLVSASFDSNSFLDLKGELIRFRNVKRVGDFNEGFAVAAVKDSGPWGFINKSGRFVIEPRFDDRPSDFSNGLARITKNHLSGFIDLTGNIVIPTKFVDADHFSEGMAAVSIAGPCFTFTHGPCGSPTLRGGGRDWNRPRCTYEYMDKSGRILTNGQFESARPFREGLAAATRGGPFGYIDKRGDWVIEPQFADAEPFSEGLARVRERNRSFGFIDQKGNWVIKPTYRFAEDFREGVTVVSEDSEEFYYLDRSGKRAFEGKYAAASPFHKGLAHVQLKSDSTSTRHYAYIDKTGRIIFKYSTVVD